MKDKIINKINLIRKNNSGFSYLEFIIGLMLITAIFYTIVQIYFLTQAQVLLMNTTRVALREVEVYGGVRNDFFTRVKDNLQKNSNINVNNLKITIIKNEGSTNPDSPEHSYVLTNSSQTTSAKFQLRTPIRIKISAPYTFTSVANIAINVGSSYVGSSQKFDKSNPDTYTPIE